MRRCLVLGSNGNLGRDLVLQLKNHKYNVFEYNERYPSSNYISDISALNPDIVFNTVGFGSIPECEKNPKAAYDAHVNLPMDLALSLPNSNIINFSTAFVTYPPAPWSIYNRVRDYKSWYAFTKGQMEDFILNNPNGNSVAVRVANLYGSHRFEKTFPGKVSVNNVTSLPLNGVTPTPTSWLAKVLVEQIDVAIKPKYGILHLAPHGECSVAEWGREIKPSIVDGGYDTSRPTHCNIGSMPFIISQNDTWRNLWLKFVLDNVNLFKGE